MARACVCTVLVCYDSRPTKMFARESKQRETPSAIFHTVCVRGRRRITYTHQALGGEVDDRVLNERQTRSRA